MTVTWSITNTEHNTDSDKGVVHAAWSATETDGDHTGTVSGMESFYPDASEEGYIAYDSLTEANVLAWVHAEVDKDATEAALTAKIAADKNPVTGSGMPW